MNGIIIEGADGTGKTTLAKALSKHYGNLDICHCTSEDPADFDFYKNTARKKNIIWDRHTIGELVYPKVFNRNAQIGIEDARIILSYAKEEGVTIIILTANKEDIKKRLINRGNECEEVINNIDYIHDEFELLSECLAVPLINTSELNENKTLEEVIKLIEKDKNFTFLHK